MRVDRRRFFTLTGAATAGLAVAGRMPAAAPAAQLDPGPFALGVASGDPEHDSVVLWTRLAPEGGGLPAADVPVRWELARDAAFSRVIRRGEVTAQAQWAHSVHVEVGDLVPDRWYWYRFSALGQPSRTGRTRTLPAPGTKPARLRFAVASCQAWVGGPYPAYRDMAEQEIDLVLHLGDYIYETANGSLEEFRRLHAQYKSSPELREAHARFPFVVTWDDHEVQNNYAAGIAGGAGDGRPFHERRANAYQAYYEHLPLRRASMPQGPDMLLYRRFHWGALAEFAVLDGRQYRSDQPCGDPFIGPVCGDEDDPARTMLGPVQERWLLDGLAASKARWNVLAQQTIMAPYDYDVGPGESRALDAWDGYPAARERILAFLAERRIANPVVLAGDWHSNWVNDLDRDGRTIASEFAGTSISSGCGWDATVRLGLPANPQVVFYEGAYRGYLLCDVTAERWRTDLRIVTAPGNPASPAYTLAAFEVADGVPGARRLDVGTGIATRVTSAGGTALPNVELQVRDGTGALLVRRLTDSRGEASVFAPPGTYELLFTGVGYEQATRMVTVADGRLARADVALSAVTLAAGTGRTLPGPLSEASVSDIVLENGEIAIAIAAVTEDGQLSPTTRGKPRDLAATGFVDQLDWMNLPYASVAQPRGGNAWQQRTVRSATVEVAGPGLVRTSGASTEAPEVAVVTTYRLEPGQRWIDAESAFSNGGAAPRTLWIGDVVDHDGTGQRSGVAGHGTITTGPADYAPSGRWIGMTGTDAQLYALIYGDDGWGAYAAGIWVMSQRQVTIAPGETLVLARRIVATAAGQGEDPWAPLSTFQFT